VNAEPVSAPAATVSSGAYPRAGVGLSGGRDEQFAAFVADLAGHTFCTDPRAYARKVLVNLRIDRWRAVRLEVLTSPDTLPQRATPNHADTVDGRNEVVRVLAELPLAQRRVVVLRHLLGLTESETARELGVSVGTVKSHNARALARLRTLLTEGQQ
jgi:RNA polymerase sigma factor (sigma-70 family)